jgi:hypothetical protein
MPETGAPMRGHHDQIHGPGGRAPDNLLVGDADHDAARDLHLCFWDQGEEMIQLLPGLLLEGLEQDRALTGRGMAVDQVGWGLHDMQDRQRCPKGLRQLNGGGHRLVGGRGEIGGG